MALQVTQAEVSCLGTSFPTMLIPLPHTILATTNKTIECKHLLYGLVDEYRKHCTYSLGLILPVMKDDGVHNTTWEMYHMAGRDIVDFIN